MKLRLASRRDASAPGRASVHHHVNGVTTAGLLGISLPTLGIGTCLPSGHRRFWRGSDWMAASCEAGRSRAAEGHAEGTGYDPHDTSGLMPLCGYSVDSIPALGQASKSFSCPEYTIPISSF